MSLYQFNQNNSFGVFDVDDKLCHRLFIEQITKKKQSIKPSNLDAILTECITGSIVLAVETDGMTTHS